MIRLIKIPFAEAISFIEQGTFFNINLSANKRLRLFTEQNSCVVCGLQGTHFYLEKHENDFKGKFHFNLYGKNKNGHDVLLTFDHIVPKALGGTDSLKNGQCMCVKCNNKKQYSFTLRDLLHSMKKGYIALKEPLMYNRSTNIAENIFQLIKKVQYETSGCVV